MDDLDLSQKKVGWMLRIGAGAFLTAGVPGFSKVFDGCGVDCVDNAFEGFNSCIFAYGQTGSGKSFTMMGTDQSPGIVPRLARLLFDRIGLFTCRQDKQATEKSVSVQASYYEIYNERVVDLLQPKGSDCRVREHPVDGPYIENLTRSVLLMLPVENAEQLSDWITVGNQRRTVASTAMNDQSSRSHAVFSIEMRMTEFHDELQMATERTSKISLVDLAGSERARKSGLENERLKEGSNINKSLSTLGLVIKSLSSGQSKKTFVPYRDSTLTWLLKEGLGGNSKTFLIATISPLSDNYDESVSTLRFATLAKRVETRPMVNEDANSKLIRELQSEVDTLKRALQQVDPTHVEHLTEQLHESRKMMEELNDSWERRMKTLIENLKDKIPRLEYGPITELIGADDTLLVVGSDQACHFVVDSLPPRAFSVGISSDMGGVSVEAFTQIFVGERNLQPGMSVIVAHDCAITVDKITFGLKGVVTKRDSSKSLPAQALPTPEASSPLPGLAQPPPQPEASSHDPLKAAEVSAKEKPHPLSLMAEIERTKQSEIERLEKEKQTLSDHLSELKKQLQEQIVITVPRKHMKIEGKPHYVYEVCVESAFKGNFKVFKRYRDFAEVHDQIKGSLPREISSVFPGKSVLGSVPQEKLAGIFASKLANLLERQAEARRIALQTYLRQVVAFLKINHVDELRSQLSIFRNVE